VQPFPLRAARVRALVMSPAGPVTHLPAAIRVAVIVPIVVISHVAPLCCGALRSALPLLSLLRHGLLARLLHRWSSGSLLGARRDRAPGQNRNGRHESQNVLLHVRSPSRRNPPPISSYACAPGRSRRRVR